MKALLSSDKMDWRTPEWFLNLVREVGPIALDPCADPNNSTGASEFFARTCSEDAPGTWLGSCGLSVPWSRDGLAFVNPPYGRHLSGPIDPGYVTKTGLGRGWAEKIAQDRGEWIALVPVRTETDWWRRLYGASDALCLWSSPEWGRRINFVDSDGLVKTGSTIASTVFYAGPRPKWFRAVFQIHGIVLPG